jgi:hypothetical protein
MQAARILQRNRTVHRCGGNAGGATGASGVLASGASGGSKSDVMLGSGEHSLLKLKQSGGELGGEALKARVRHRRQPGKLGRGVSYSQSMRESVFQEASTGVPLAARLLAQKQQQQQHGSLGNVTLSTGAASSSGSVGAALSTSSVDGSSAGGDSPMSSNTSLVELPADVSPLSRSRADTDVCAVLGRRCLCVFCSLRHG